MQHRFERPPIGVADLPRLGGAPEPRSTGVRTPMFVGLLVALVLPAVLAGVVGAQIAAGGVYASDADYQQAVNHATLLGYLFCVPGYLLFFARMAPRVSYRPRDAFMLFVPVWGYVFVARVLWRLTALRDQPWPQRLVELADRHWADEHWA